MESGILNLDKPAGMTSARVVGAVKHMLPRGTKVGHAGTLDRFATGVLLILVGTATKKCEALMDQRKTYEATIKLGATTETDDPESEEHASPGLVVPSCDAVESALRVFVGEIMQRPPRYSALKIGGKRASDRARADESVELAPRKVQVYDIELMEFSFPMAMVRVECGRGTYIRSIARDLGEMLGVGGYLTQLCRTRIGEFEVEKAVPLSQLDAATVSRHLHPL